MGFIPWTRQSNAYGYAQALDCTWARYKNDRGRRYADRDNFDDAIDFIGWFTNLSNKSAGISKWDPYNQYLAYHLSPITYREGQAGWQRGSYKQKSRLKKSARQVDIRAREWSIQLQSCRAALDDRWWMFRL